MRYGVFWSCGPRPFSGFTTILLSIALAALGSCVNSIEGRSQTTMATQTSSWYAKHHRERERIVRLCRDDPAMARVNGDCINALHAQIEAAEREGRRRIDMTPPTSPRYWQDRPLERMNHLELCRGMTPLEQVHNFCDVARRS